MPDLRSEIVNILDTIPVDIGGGCSVTKAYLMAELIRKNRLKTTVDIGVYRGRSLFPQAVAHKLYTGGVVYGIDPFSNVEAVEANAPSAIQSVVSSWATTTDFEALYQENLARRTALGLEKSLILLRQQSDQAVTYFQEHNLSIDMVHIDGNHDAALVTQDFELYVPLVAPEGYVVLDDMSWDSVKPVFTRLKDKMQLVFKLRDSSNDFAVFWNSNSWLKAQSRHLGLRNLK